MSSSRRGFRRRYLIAAAVSVATLAVGTLPPVAAGAAVVGTKQSVVPGVVVWRVHFRSTNGRSEYGTLMSVDLTNRRLGINAAIARSREGGDFRPLSALADSTGAVAGINADFFNLGSPNGPTSGGFIRSGAVYKTPRRKFDANLYVRPNRTAAIGAVPFYGTLVDGTARTELRSINNINDAQNGYITKVTHLAANVHVPSSCRMVTLALGTKSARVLGASSGHFLASVPANRAYLVGCHAGARWLSLHARAGSTLTSSITFPNGKPHALVSGGRVLIKDGRRYLDRGNIHHVTGYHAETFTCVSRDGQHLLMGVVDNYTRRETGISNAGLTNYLLGKRCWSAVVFDGGGSTTLVARTQRGSGAQVMNDPADGAQRWIPDGLFVYQH